MNSTRAIYTFLQAVPDYQVILQALLKEWEPDTPEICLIFAAFSHRTIILFQESQMDIVKKAFEIAETLLLTEDTQVRDAIATCFLENILNRVPETVTVEAFKSVLGTESRRHCIAWNEFTGIHLDL